MIFIEKAKSNQCDEGDDNRNDDDNDDDTGGQDGGPSSEGKRGSRTLRKLCDKVIRWKETILDHYWKLLGSAEGKKKPRIYRKVARWRFLKLTKHRRKSEKNGAELRNQQGCIHRNLDFIEGCAPEYGLEVFIT